MRQIDPYAEVDASSFDFKDMLTKLLANMFSRSGSAGKLQILTYHRVLDQDDEYIDDVSVHVFEEHVRILSSDFNVLRLDRASKLLSEGRLPQRSVCITFDDGYADNYDVAFPILKKYGVTATFFVATGFLDGGTMWNDVIKYSCKLADDTVILDAVRRRGQSTDNDISSIRLTLIHETIRSVKYLDINKRNEKVKEFAAELATKPVNNLMMTSAQVADLADCGMEIGAHTVNHPILKKMSIDEARTEIQVSRDSLEQIIGNRVTSFAFPNGRWEADFDDSHVKLLDELKFVIGVSTEFACARKDDNRLMLPRVALWGETQSRITFRLLHNYLRH